ncbi:MAG: hypothetical protein ACSHX8_03340 [Opitutaceae bacterium]
MKNGPSFLDLKSNLKSLVRLLVLVSLLGVIAYLAALKFLGKDAVDRLVASVAKTEVVLKDSVENIPSSSYLSIPIELPYAGNVLITAKSEDNQKFSTYLIADSDYPLFKKAYHRHFRGEFYHYTDFHIERQSSMTGKAAFDQGLYHLVIESNQIGAPANSFINVSVLAELKP